MDVESESSRPVAIPTLRLMLARTAAFGLSFVLPLLLVRRLDQAEYGLYKQAFLLVSTALSVLLLGFQMSAFYFLPREPERQAAVVSNIVIFHTLAAGLGCVALIVRPDLLIVIFRDPALVPYAPLIGIIILLWGMSFSLEYIPIANREAGLAAAFIVAMQLTRAVMLVCAVMLFGSITALLWSAVIHGVLQVVVLMAYLHTRFGSSLSQLSWSMMRTQLTYAVPLGAAGLLWSAQMDAPHYFVSHHFSTAAYAIYAVGCFQLPLIAVITEAAGSVMISRVCILRQYGERQQIIEATAKLIRLVSMIYLPVYVFFLLVGSEFLRVMFTDAYISSWPIFMINLTMIPLSIIASAYDPILRAYPEFRYIVLRIRLVLLIASLAVLWSATERLGLIGVITLVVLVNGLERLLIGRLAIRIVGVRWHDLVLLKDVGKLAGAAVLASITVVPVRWLFGTSEPIVVLGLSTLGYATGFLAAVLMLRVTTRDEWRLLWAMTGKLPPFTPSSQPADLAMGRGLER